MTDEYLSPPITAHAELLPPSVYEELVAAAEDLGNRTKSVEVAGRHMVYDGLKRRLVEVEPKQRPDINATIGDLNDFVTAVKRFQTPHTSVFVGRDGVSAFLDYESATHQDKLTLQTYCDSMAADAGHTTCTLTGLVDQIERLMDVGTVVDGEDLLQILRFLVVKDTSSAEIQEKGAHISIETKASQTVQGTKNGAPVDLPKVIQFEAPYGTRWRLATYRLRMRVDAGGNGLRFHFTHLNDEQMERDWIEHARHYLQEHLDDTVLVVSSE